MEVLQTFLGHEGRVMRAVWGPLNQTLISAGEDGSLRLWDVEARAKRPARCRRLVLLSLASLFLRSCRCFVLQTGKQLAENRDHKKQINDLTMSADLTHFITGSLDKTAKVWVAS